MINFFLVPNQNSTTIAELVKHKKIKHLVTDRGLAVSKIEKTMHQYCLVHLMRNVQGLAEHPSTSISNTERLGGIYDALQLLFADKSRLNKGEIQFSTWLQYNYEKWRYILEEIEEILENNPEKKLQRFCNRILRDWKHFKVYLRARGDPMTNNPAEEALRNLVIVRKLCFGSRSDYGRSWREKIQSCIETLKRQGQSILDFLTQIIQSSRTGLLCPLIQLIN